MSWTVSFLGKPEAVAAALEKHSETLSGQSRLEYDEAKPHLVALVRQNFAAEGTYYVCPLIDLDASGSGSSDGGKQVQRTLTVKLTPQYKTLV